MGINAISYRGNILIDLSNDTISSNKFLTGRAIGSDGELLSSNLTPISGNLIGSIPANSYVSDVASVSRTTSTLTLTPSMQAYQNNSLSYNKVVVNVDETIDIINTPSDIDNLTISGEILELSGKWVGINPKYLLTHVTDSTAVPSSLTGFEGSEDYSILVYAGLTYYYLIYGATAGGIVVSLLEIPPQGGTYNIITRRYCPSNYFDSITHIDAKVIMSSDEVEFDKSRIHELLVISLESDGDLVAALFRYSSDRIVMSHSQSDLSFPFSENTDIIPPKIVTSKPTVFGNSAITKPLYHAILAYYDSSNYTLTSQVIIISIDETDYSINWISAESGSISISYTEASIDYFKNTNRIISADIPLAMNPEGSGPFMTPIVWGINSKSSGNSVLFVLNGLRITNSLAVTFLGAHSSFVQSGEIICNIYDTGSFQPVRTFVITNSKVALLLTSTVNSVDLSTVDSYTDLLVIDDAYQTNEPFYIGNNYTYIPLGLNKFKLWDGTNLSDTYSCSSIGLYTTPTYYSKTFAIHLQDLTRIKKYKRVLSVKEYESGDILIGVVDKTSWYNLSLPTLKWVINTSSGQSQNHPYTNRCVIPNIEMDFYDYMYWSPDLDLKISNVDHTVIGKRSSDSNYYTIYDSVTGGFRVTYLEDKIDLSKTYLLGITDPTNIISR